MQNDYLDYFLFPRLTLSEQDFRGLAVFLPKLSIFQVATPAAIPEWCRDRFTGRPFIRDPEFLGLVKSGIQGYRAFAEAHGGGGMMGYLSQALDDMSDTRFRIQEELRGKYPVQMDPATIDLLRSAIFLDISRELDDRAQELDSSYARADKIEKQFRDILGIDEDEAGEVPEDMSIPLLPESSSHEYMLPERIRNWFHLFAVESPGSMPVFVTTDPDALRETLDIIHPAVNREGKDFEVFEFSLGAFPRPDQLGQKQFLSLTESPGSPALLASYRENLDLFLRKAAESPRPGTLESEAETLAKGLRKFCGDCDIEDLVTLRLTLPQGLTISDIEAVLGLGTAPGDRQNSSTTGGMDSETRPALFLCLE
ncbi:MAG: hypothetical protein ABFD97_05030 [Syntrophobacter sp.]